MADNKSPLKNLINFFVRVGFSVALLWYLFTKIDTEKTLDVLSSAKLGYLVLGFGVFFFTNILILFRWFIFIRALDLEARPRDVIRYFFFGLFGNLFLPSAVGGDLIKIVGLCRNSAQKPRVVASVILDRLSGFAAISIVAIVSYTFGYRLIGEASILVLILLMGAGALMMGCVLLNERIYTWGTKVFAFVPKFQAALMQMHFDIALLKGTHKQKEGLKGVGISVVSQVIFAGCFYLIGRGLHLDLSMGYYLIFIPMICVAAAFPSIGGLGVREAGAAYLFTKVGVDAGVAVSMSLINFLYMVLIGLIGGLIYVATVSSRRV